MEIKISYSPISYCTLNLDMDIPEYSFTSYKDAEKFIKSKLENRLKDEIVFVYFHNEEVIITSNPIYLYWYIENTFKFTESKFPNNNNVLSLFEYYSYEAAYEVAFLFKENNKLCYEPNINTSNCN